MSFRWFLELSIPFPGAWGRPNPVARGGFFRSRFRCSKRVSSHAADAGCRLQGFFLKRMLASTGWPDSHILGSIDMRILASQVPVPFMGICALHCLGCFGFGSNIAPHLCTELSRHESLESLFLEP